MYTLCNEVVEMQLIAQDNAIDLMKKAQMISSSKYGHYVDFEHNNCFNKQNIIFSPDSQILKSKHAFGDLLFIKENDGIETIAFIFDPNFLPKR